MGRVYPLVALPVNVDRKDHTLMARQQERTAIVIPMDDGVFHTDRHPFSSNPICPYHEGQGQQDTPPASSFPDLSTLSTLWMPPHEVRQQWAAFGQEALTTSALMATSTAFGGLYWEAHALQHCTWAAQERKLGRWHQVVFWLSRAVQDLDCALDQWQQAQRMLDLAGNDHRQQDPQSLQTIRTLMAQIQWHQGRRRAMHQQVLTEYIEARQQGREHRTGPLSEEPEEEV